ncbi:MAG: alpha/beta hydrolase domain-containing protein [Novosphingobium sp.]|nr:alpha/beta hydrolase domain-containing protein [Novosphingobium sp.]
MRLAVRHLILLLALTMPGLASADPAKPQLRFEIQSREVAFDGESFSAHGQYEKITAIAHMRIDPKAPDNLKIVDLALAPRSADGMVEYDTDVVIIRPVDTARARQVMLYEVVNRGMRLLAMMTGAGYDADAAGDGLIMRQGYTVVASGWQSDVKPALIDSRFPVATRGGRPITGRVSAERIFEDLTGNQIALPYAAASLDQSTATLTVRATGRDDPATLPVSDWSFDNERGITLTRPEGYDAGAIYRFTYVARDPVVTGLGFAATRDLITWLRHASAEDGNPLADIAGAPCEKDPNGKCVATSGGAYSSAVAFGGSQSGRYLRDFLWQGFNRDLAGRKVFDGIIPFIPGARQTFTNFRFGEPGRFSRQHEDHDVPGFGFPYAYATLTDPVTGRRDGIMQSCRQDGTCPKLFHIDTGGEFWQAASSLVGTGGTAGDVAFPEDVRAFMIAGGAHATGMTMPACKFPANALNYSPVVRALVLSMVDWTTGHSAPPDSRWPRLDKGELATVEELEFPNIASRGLYKPKALNQPIAPIGRPDWPIHVPVVDADGNDLPGIRMPELSAPGGTYLSWSLRKPGFAEDELCLIFGSYLPLADNAETRGDDPRPSFAERYPDPKARAERYIAATNALNQQGFLLDEDAAKLRKKVGGE